MTAAKAEAKARSPRPRSFYEGQRPYGGASRTDPDLRSFNPSMISGQAALSADRDVLASRIHDLARNNGWASGAVTKHVDSVIGAGWRLSHKPIWKRLGINKDQAEEFAEQVEAAWLEYVSDPDFWADAQRQTSVAGKLALAYRHRIMDGEAFGRLIWRDGRAQRPGYQTAIEIIDPDRVGNPGNKGDEERLKQGVELGRYGEPVAYHVRVSHPGEDRFSPKARQWKRIQRETPWGRRNMLHAFESSRAGMVRGEPLLAPIVKRLRMLDRYDEAETQAALLNAILAAVLHTDNRPGEIIDGIDQAGGEADPLMDRDVYRQAHYEENPVQLNGVAMTVLPAGDKLSLMRPEHPHTQFEAFERVGLRNIASASGLSYEQISSDWSQVNYSSARAALLEIWRGFTSRKAGFAAQFMQPWFAAWFEEAVDKGRIVLPDGAPSFWDAKAAYTNSEWIGPGRGWVDPQKEAAASQLRVQGGLSTMERECAEQGLDWKEVADQRHREREYLSALGLESDATAAVAASDGGQELPGDPDGDGQQ